MQKSLLGTTCKSFSLRAMTTHSRPDPNLGSLPPIAESALGVGDGDNKNDVVFLLKNHGIRKSFQYSSAGVLCKRRVELRMGDDLREGGGDFGKKCIGGFGAALEIPIKCRINLFPSL